jgi:hypothetical protein
VGVKTEEERNEEMVSVPERLERLLTDASVSTRIHQQHAEKHDMTSDSTRLSIMNLKSQDRSDLSQLDVIEVDVVSACVKASEEEDGVGELAMHPEILVEWNESNLGSNPTHDGSTYGEQDKHAVDAEN